MNALVLPGPGDAKFGSKNGRELSVNFEELGLQLQAIAGITAQDLESVRASEEQFYQMLNNVVAQSRCSAADLVDLLNHHKIHYSVRQLAELPRWRSVLSDPGGSVSPSVTRDLNLAVIADAAEVDGGLFSRCFVVVTKAKFDSLDSSTRSSLVVAARAAKYRVAGWIVVPDELMPLLYSEWDRRNAGGGEGDDATDSQALFDSIAHACFKQGASDIHVTVYHTHAVIRARVDGRLEHFRELSVEGAKSMLSAAYNTLADEGSTQGNLNMLLRQDGNITRKYTEGTVRFRYSGIPLFNGYDAVMRINTAAIEGKVRVPEALGYSDDQLAEIHRGFAHTSGMVLFVGTTGSGKTESLGAFLNHKGKQSPGKLIRTLEEPVEVPIPSARQTQFSRVGNESFQGYMRAMLRTDPDTLAIAEIRDDVTAQLAFTAVRSGHLLPSTLHVNEALGAFERLIGLGVPRSDVAGTGLVRLVVFQRLIPLVCGCSLAAREAMAIATINSTGIFKRLETAGIACDGLRFENPAGCAKCSYRGRLGRTLAAEVVKPSLQMLRAVLDGRSADLYALWRATRSTDHSVMRGRTAFEHALHKMKQGLVSPLGVEEEFHMIDDIPYEVVND